MATSSASPQSGNELLRHVKAMDVRDAQVGYRLLGVPLQSTMSKVEVMYGIERTLLQE